MSSNALDGSKHAPGVMISSTFYDLRQIREDLRRFVQDELGYRALVSEHPSFPVNPDANVIDNCRERVERDADVLVLVIGGRYGSVDQASAKSVTNLEYLAARQKGIPVFAFVERGIADLIPVWKANPGADFSSKVDTPLLFEFVEQVRSIDRVWVYPFDSASDITSALRIQFAYQHRECLLISRRLRDIGDQRWLSKLHGQTLRIALEKPKGWEYRLFASALIDAVARHDHLLQRHESNIPLGLGEDVDDPITWSKARLADGLRMANALAELFNVTLQEAFGPEGTPGDAKKIVFVADTMGAIYGDALQWSARVRAANVEERFGKAMSILSRILNHVIHSIRDYGPIVGTSFEKAIAAQSTGGPQVLDLTLTISVPEGVLAELNAELGRLTAELRR